MSKLEKLLTEYRNTFASILPFDFNEKNVFKLDLSVNNSELKNIKVGDKINKGEIFAKIGNSKENGNWPPHLHFQLISDMKGNWGDFPGVSSKQEKDKWLELCPDPMLMFNHSLYL